MANHCVLFDVWDEAPVSVGILAVVEEVLAADGYRRMAKKSIKEPSQLGFLFQGPVPRVVSSLDEGNTDGVGSGP